jgi:hypothetical protein
MERGQRNKPLKKCRGENAWDGCRVRKRKTIITKDPLTYSRLQLNIITSYPSLSFASNVQ